MAGLTEYRVTIGGVVHTMLLDEHDVERYGDQAVEVKAAKPQNKAKTPSNKGA